LATDKSLDRKVAIKEYLPLDLASRDSDNSVRPMSGEQGEIYQGELEHFLKEARILAKIKHPNIVHVLSVFEFNNTAYMVMEYEQGQKLSRIYEQSKEPFTEQALLDIFIPILGGLAVAHKEGFIHRDIKPANIYIREDESPVLLNFASARQTLVGKTTPLTSLVTAGYASIEQYNESAGKQGPWTDIYGIAACLYTGICGKKPENAINRGTNIINNGVDSYEPVSALAADKYSNNFLLAIDYGLRFQPEERPQDTQEWADMLSGKKSAPDFRPSVKVDADVLADLDITVTEPTVPVHPQAQETPPKETISELEVRPELDEDRTVTMPVSKAVPQTPAKPKEDITLPSTTELFSPKLTAAKPKPPPSAPPQEAPIREGEYQYAPPPHYRLNKMKKSLWMLGPVALVAASVALAVFLFFIRVDVPDKPPGIDQDKIAHLLAEAEQDIAENRLLEPEGEAAVNHYLEVLDMDPDNHEAQQGLNNILQHLGNIVEQHIEENQLDKAEPLILAIEAIAPLSPNTLTLRQRFNNALERREQLPTLLAQAQQAFDDENYLSPTDENAYVLYTEILSIDPDNLEAKQAIEQMAAYYESQARQFINAGNIQEANQTISKLEILSAESAAALRPQIEELASHRRTELATLLKQGDNALHRNRLTKPVNKNSLYYYQQALQIDERNERALKGIQAVHSRLESIFNKQLEQFQFAKAEKTLNTIKSVAPNTKLAARAEQRYLSLGPKAIPEVEIVSNLMDQFKNSLESQDLKKMRNLSEYQEGRHQFVQQFFGNYRSYQVKISGFQYIAEDHKAIANVSLSHLINKKGEVVQPGPWSDFEIEISKNEKAQWKVHW
jgi:serine/threonine protein kinase